MLASVWSAGIAAASAAENPRPFVIPELKSWHGGEGRFVPTEDTRIVYPSGDETLERVARMLADDCAEMFGFRPAIAAGRGGRGDVSLAVKADKELGDEGYAVAISGKRVDVKAPTAKGVYWATRTLLQMAEQSDDRSLPCGEVRDWPDYAVRGLMIDCGRKFIPLHFLQDYVKILAYYKMNTLQIHLNDNGFKQYFEDDWNKTYAAFRLESETYPDLTARDGSYSKREFIDLQKLAEERFVEIIPEIDAPAHTLAFSHYDPQLGSKEYGMDHLDLFNPATYEFLDGLFKEYPTCSIRPPTNFSTASSRSTFRVTTPSSAGRACISAPTSTRTRIRPWSRSSASSPTGTYALWRATASRRACGVR